jgi:isoamylase
VRLGAPDKAEHSRSLAITATSLSGDLLMHFALNAYWEALEFELPALPGWASSGWRRVMDTSLPSPGDLMMEFADAEPVIGSAHRVQPRSVVALFAGQLTTRP